jgi:hypothetical protein
MPEISEQDFAALAAQVASLSSALAVARRRIDDLEEGMTDHLGLDWGESLVDANSPHPNISANTIESGGGAVRQDVYGMQVESASEASAVHFVGSLSTNPTAEATRGILAGEINTTNTTASVYLRAYGDTSKSSALAVSADAQDDEYSVKVVDGWFGISTALTPSQITSNQNNYAPTNYQYAGVLRLSSDASRDITGILGDLDGRILPIFNVGSFDIVLKDEDAGSTAANRFALQADITIPPDGAAILWYDSTSSRWRCVGTY